MTLARAGAALLCCAALGGCAVGGGTLSIAADRRFPLAALDALVPGTEAAAVVAALGLPASFGVDDRGRRYLQYNVYSLGSHVFGAGTGVVGVNAMVIQSSAQGFEARVYLEKGRVTRVATRVYERAPQADTDADAASDAAAGRTGSEREAAPVWQDSGRAHLLDDPA
jgi:hypothetical protein